MNLATRPLPRHYCLRLRGELRRALYSPAAMAVPKPALRCGSLTGRDGGDVEERRIPRIEGGWNHPHSPVRGPWKQGLQR